LRARQKGTTTGNDRRNGAAVEGGRSWKRPEIKISGVSVANKTLTTEPCAAAAAAAAYDTR